MEMSVFHEQVMYACSQDIENTPWVRLLEKVTQLVHNTRNECKAATV